MFISLLFGILGRIKASAFAISYRPGRSVYAGRTRSGVNASSGDMVILAIIWDRAAGRGQPQRTKSLNG